MRNPALAALSWWVRVSAVRAVDEDLRASGHVRGSMAAVEAVKVTSQLVREDADEAEAVMRLQAMRGGRKALRNAAQMLARYANDGYPHSRMYRLLRAASGDPVPPPTSEDLVREGRERQLLLQPLDTSFSELARQVPELRQLEMRVRTDPASLLHELPPSDMAMLTGPPPRPDFPIRDLLTMKALDEAVQQLVGPSSGQSDPVLASSAAFDVASHYLNKLTGIDPQSWLARGRP